MRLLTVITCFCALGLLACSSTKEIYRRSPNYDRNYIFPNEIQSSAANNAFDLIRNLRPLWLRGRGSKSVRYGMASYPVIYVDGSRYANINSLATIPAGNIVQIQFMSAGDATIRFGVNHPGGAILITMFY